MRTIIDLKEKQLNALKEIGEQTKLSRAELIRRAVNDYIDKLKARDQQDVFGLWKDKSVDALEYQNAQRQEWTDESSS